MMLEVIRPPIRLTQPWGDGICDDGTGRCSLLVAIMEANTLPCADTIILPGGTYTLSLTVRGEDASESDDLDITDSLTFIGTGAEAIRTAWSKDICPCPERYRAWARATLRQDMQP